MITKTIGLPNKPNESSGETKSNRKIIHYRTRTKRHLLQPQHWISKHGETLSKSKGVWIES